MSKTGVLSIVILVVVLIAGGLLIGGGDEDVEISSFEECAAAGYPVMESYPEQCRTPDGRSFVNEVESIVPIENSAQAGSYEPYSQELLARASSGKVVLFFRASWCPTCRTLDADIRANLDDIPESVTILDVNYDDSTQLKQKYGVTYQHTLVQVDASGNELAQWTRSPTLQELLTNIR